MARYNKMIPEKSRKGQQALEYLVTYGWAFVVVIITVGAFAYFGILSPQKYIPNRCDFGSQFSCADYIVVADDTGSKQGVVLLKLQNNFGVDIQVLDVTTADGDGTYCLSSTYETNPFSCDLYDKDAELTVIEGELSDTLRLQLDGSSYFAADKDKIAIPIRVSFRRLPNSDTPPTHFLIGEVFAGAQGYADYLEKMQG